MIRADEVEKIVSVGKLVIRECEVRIAFDRLVQQSSGLGQFRCLRCSKNSGRDERFGLYVQIVSNEISRWYLLDRRLFARRDFGLKLRDYLPCNLALNGKYVRGIAIVTFRPKLAVRPRIDQLSLYAHSTTGALHCAFQYMRDAQAGGDLTQVSLHARFVLHYRCTANYFQVGHSGKASEDFILHAICKVGVLLLVTQVFKWKHSDAFFRRS